MREGGGYEDVVIDVDCCVLGALGAFVEFRAGDAPHCGDLEAGGFLLTVAKAFEVAFEDFIQAAGYAQFGIGDLAGLFISQLRPLTEPAVDG